MQDVARLVVTLAILSVAIPAWAQEPPGRPACLVIDESRDTFSPEDRRASLILVSREFERAGRPLVIGECAESYALSHVRLGNTIVVTLSGPAGQRDGRAAEMDDLPGLYNQIVRALLTGSTVGAMRVTDRTNVTAPQAQPRRVGIDSFGYARLGYGVMLGNGGGSHPAFGFGYRAELDSWGLDVSFLNQQIPSSHGYGTGGMSGSLLKLQALYFTNPRANASAYFGGGLSWGITSGSNGGSAESYQSWHGSGLQGDVTAGYELPRASDLRVFVQADATLPFYRTAGTAYTYSQGHSTTVRTGHRYHPTVALSVGVGWQRRRN